MLFYLTAVSHKNERKYADDEMALAGADGEKLGFAR